MAAAWAVLFLAEEAFAQMPIVQTVSLKRGAAFIVLLGAPVALLLAQPSLTRAPASAAYERAVDEERWDEALTFAEMQVVQGRLETGSRPAALIESLTRLGYVQSALKNHGAAEAAYTEAVAIGMRSPEVVGLAVRPLRGLATTFISRGEYERAISALEQALRISSRAMGIFDASQAEMLRLLAHAQTQEQRFTDAEQTLKYYLQLHEHAHGVRDAKTFEARVTFADWYVYVGELTTARSLLRLTVADAEKTFGSDAAELVAPLRGLGRSYMVQLLYGPRIVGKLTDPKVTSSIWSGYRVRGYVPPQWLQREDARALEGEGALLRALKIAERTPEKRGQLLGLLLDLGDWFEYKHDPERALEFYRRAQASARSSTPPSEVADLFSFPFNIHLPQIEADEKLKDDRFVLVEYSVNANGRTEAERVVESNASERERTRALRAVQRALYRPRFVGGNPVRTEGLRYRFVFK